LATLFLFFIYWVATTHVWVLLHSPLLVDYEHPRVSSARYSFSVCALTWFIG